MTDKITVDEALRIRDIELEKLKRYIHDNGLNSNSRKQELAFQRHYVCAYCDNVLGLGRTETSELLGRSHATVISSINKHNNLINDDKYLSDIFPVASVFPMSNRLKFKESIDIIHTNIVKNTKPRVKIAISNDKRNFHTFLTVPLQYKLKQIKEELEMPSYGSTLRELVKLYELKNQ